MNNNIIDKINLDTIECSTNLKVFPGIYNTNNAILAETIYELEKEFSEIVEENDNTIKTLKYKIRSLQMKLNDYINNTNE